MSTRDYISAIAIKRLLEDETLPADIRQQAEQVLADINRIEFKRILGPLAKRRREYFEDESGETEAAIECERFYREEE